MNNTQKPEDSKKITEKRKTGNLGEDIACIYLKKLGFTIVDRNYLRKYGEIDIVAKKEGIVHFVEVKTVTSHYAEAPKDKRETPEASKDGYKPEDNIHPWKLKRLSRVIQAYLLDKRITGDWQFDAVTVILNMKTRKARVTSMENIVL